MRRIYLVVVILLLLAAFYGGYRYGRAKDNGSVDIDMSYLRDRQRLTEELTKSRSREDSFKTLTVESEKIILKRDSTIKSLEKQKVAAAQKYKAKIDAVSQYATHELEALIVNRYPDTVSYRQSFNKSLRQIPIAEWRVQAMAIDLIKMDSMSEQSVINASIAGHLNEAIGERDVTIKYQALEISQKDSTINLLQEREHTYAVETAAWELAAKKYKRQRNAVIVGGVVVTIGVTTLVILAAN